MYMNGTLVIIYIKGNPDLLMSSVAPLSYGFIFVMWLKLSCKVLSLVSSSFYSETQQNHVGQTWGKAALERPSNEQSWQSY